MHIGTPLTDGYNRDAQLFCQPFTRLLVLDKNNFDSIKRSFAHLYLIKIKCIYNKIQCLHQRIIKKSGFERLQIKFFCTNAILLAHFYNHIFMLMCSAPYPGIHTSINHFHTGITGIPSSAPSSSYVISRHFQSSCALAYFASGGTSLL